MAHISKKNSLPIKIKVIGVGGSGCNAISRMAASGISGVDLFAINTDAQDLKKAKAHRKLRIGRKLTLGLGAGMNPEIGRKAAEENRSEISELLSDSDIVFITFGLGGGTGSGAAPVVAEIARQRGALTIGVVLMPFSFEGGQRAKIARQGLENLKSKIDSLFIIPNDKLISLIGPDTTLISAFWTCDEILRQAIVGITDLIFLTGMINIDFANIKTIMANSGPAFFGTGRAKGEKRAEEAAKAAAVSHLLDCSLAGAKKVLFNISGREDLKLTEVDAAAKIITETVHPEAKIIFGVGRDNKLAKGEIRVMVIATGFDAR